MDSRIEELAAVIQDHAKAQADMLQAGGWRDKDRYQVYRKCEWLALDILTAIHQYRIDHRDEYQDKPAAA